MSRAVLGALFALFVFGGCTSHQESTPVVEKRAPMYVDENTLILFALDAQNHHKYAEAVGYYDLLYKRTQDKIYRDHALSALMSGRYYNDVVMRLDHRRQGGEKLSENDVRYLIVALLGKNDLTRAQEEAKALVTRSQSEKNYMMLAEVYRSEKEYIKMLSTLEKAYALNYSEAVLEKISMVIYTQMKSPYEAIGRIERHCKNFGYSLLLTKRLAAFYADQRDEAGLLKTYPHLYELEPTQENADVLIQLYWNANKIQDLIRFLETTGTNDDLLLKLYSSKKQFDKAIVLAEKLYKESGDLDYLGQKAIYQYEAAKDRSDPKLLDTIISDLTKVVAVKEEGYYLNYLGYSMIEHDRDVKGGMEYIRRALAIEPESGYFIDSLAWGYYKQGKCQKAAELMKKVVERLGADDPEVKAHLKAINMCIKRKK